MHFKCYSTISFLFIIRWLNGDASEYPYSMPLLIRGYTHIPFTTCLLKICSPYFDSYFSVHSYIFFFFLFVVYYLYNSQIKLLLLLFPTLPEVDCSITDLHTNEIPIRVVSTDANWVSEEIEIFQVNIL